jgi:hypothetical protein
MPGVTGKSGVIRKLKSGKYRLYSRKKNPKQESAETWERSRQSRRRGDTSEQFSTSSGIK